MLEALVRQSVRATLGGEAYDEWMHQRGTMMTDQKWSASPLDLFYYPNDGPAASTTNCIDHKDPGLMSAIPCAKIAGLMVRQHCSTNSSSSSSSSQWSGGPRWFDVEATPGCLHYRDIAVFPGVEMETLTAGAICATIHGVRKEVGAPRVSIVFELRSEVAPDACSGGGNSSGGGGGDG